MHEIKFLALAIIHTQIIHEMKQNGVETQH